jgi:hypothetical protein
MHFDENFNTCTINSDASKLKLFLLPNCNLAFPFSPLPKREKFQPYQMSHASVIRDVNCCSLIVTYVTSCYHPNLYYYISPPSNTKNFSVLQNFSNKYEEGWKKCEREKSFPHIFTPSESRRTRSIGRMEELFSRNINFHT